MLVLVYSFHPNSFWSWYFSKVTFQYVDDFFRNIWCSKKASCCTQRVRFSYCVVFFNSCRLYVVYRFRQVIAFFVFRWQRTLSSSLGCIQSPFEMSCAEGGSIFRYITNTRCPQRESYMTDTNKCARTIRISRNNDGNTKYFFSY